MEYSQAPLSMEFSRQEYCGGLLFPSPGGLPDPGTEPGSPALEEDCLPPEPPGKQVHTRTQNEMQKPGGRMQITQDKDPTSKPLSAFSWNGHEIRSKFL